MAEAEHVHKFRAWCLDCGTIAADCPKRRGPPEDQHQLCQFCECGETVY